MTGVLLSGLNVEGGLPLDAVLVLGERLTHFVSDVPLCPERVIVHATGLHVVDAEIDPRWRAPEVRATTGPVPPTAELWSLGRLLLEAALGTQVEDEVADDATEERLRALRTTAGAPLQPRLVEILAVLLNPKATERLQSKKAAGRVFSDAEHKLAAGGAVLDDVFAQLLAQAAQQLEEEAANGVGNPNEEPRPTVALKIADVLDKTDLQRVANQAAEERKRLQQKPVRRTEEMSAKSILDEQALERLSASMQPENKKRTTSPPLQKMLPTQIVRARDLAVDAEIVPAALPQQPQPKLLAAPADAPSAPPSAAAATAPSSAPTTDEVVGLVASERRRKLWVVAALCGIVVVILAIAAIASATNGPAHGL